MDQYLVFQYILVSTISIGCLNIVVPCVTKANSLVRLYAMLLVSTCYILSVLALGILYIQVGPTNCTLMHFGVFKLRFHLEPLGLTFLSLLSSLWFVSIMYTHGYLRCLKLSNESTEVMISACVVTASVIALSANIFTMFIFYEILTLCTIPLIYNAPGIPGINLRQYLRPLLYPSLLFFVPAVVYISNMLHTSYISETILLLLCIFGISKIALVPFHTWILSAMVALHPVSALLHGVAVVNSGIFVICKILLYDLKIVTSPPTWIVLIPGITIVYSGIKATMAKDIKQILAYSTVNQLAICSVAALLLTKTGIIAAVVFILSTSFAKISLFFIAGNIYLELRMQKLEDLRGICRLMPGNVGLFIIGGLSLMGAPLIAGGIGKYSIIIASIEAGNNMASTLVVVGFILSAVCWGRVIYVFCSRSFGALSLASNTTEWTLVLPPALCSTVIFGFIFIAHAVEKLMRFI
jgi:multicomponent Na+:H+ antiporter subunit D